MKRKRVSRCETHPFFLYTLNNYQIIKVQTFEYYNHTGFTIFVVFFFYTSFSIDLNDFFEAKKLQKSLLCLP